MRGQVIPVLPALLALGLFGSAAARAEQLGCGEVEESSERFAEPAMLNVCVEPHPEDRGGQSASYAEPGWTSITIETYGFVRAEIHGAGRTTVYKEDNNVDFPWTCSHPGTVYHYAVRAGTRPVLTRRGTFRGASVSYCKLLRKRRRGYEASCRASGGEPRIVPATPAVRQHVGCFSHGKAIEA